MREQIRASIGKTMLQVVPDQDLSDLKGDTPIRQKVGLGSVDFPDIIMQLGRRYRVGAPDNDHLQLATLDSSIAYVESLGKGLETKMVLTLFFSAPGHCYVKERQPQQSQSIRHRK
jgi:acyl carrier protein